MTDAIGGSNKINIYGYGGDIGLEFYQMFLRAWPLIDTMLVHMLDIGGDCALQDPQRYWKWFYFDYSAQKCFRFTNCAGIIIYWMWYHM